jgi:hypothetical protein
MGLYINREEKRSQLQEKLAADLKNKLSSSTIKADETDPAFLEDAHQTRPAGMVIIVLVVMLIIAATITFVLTMK